MTLKTFNIDDKSYKQYSEYCKKQGISMSKRVEVFIKKELEKIKGHHIPMKEIKNKLPQPTEPHHENPSEHHSFAKYC